MDSFNTITDESEDEHSIATTLTHSSGVWCRDKVLLNYQSVSSLVALHSASSIGVTVDPKAPVFDPSRKRGGSIKKTFVCRSLCAVAYFAAFIIQSIVHLSTYTSV